MSPDLFSRCQFFDLPDYLTYRATGFSTRSCCSLICKCSYVAGTGWQSEFFNGIGLSDFVESNYKQLGAVEGDIQTGGVPIGNGLSKKAAQELGLAEGTPVGSAVIDA
jgi:ribulose kinase